MIVGSCRVLRFMDWRQKALNDFGLGPVDRAEPVQAVARKFRHAAEMPSRLSEEAATAQADGWRPVMWVTVARRDLIYRANVEVTGDGAARRAVRRIINALDPIAGTNGAHPAPLEVGRE